MFVFCSTTQPQHSPIGTSLPSVISKACRSATHIIIRVSGVRVPPPLPFKIKGLAPVLGLFSCHVGCSGLPR
jgi:hypothetical protein